MGKYKPGEKALHLVLSGSDHAAYHQIAKNQGLSVSAWARQQLSTAAGRAMLGVETPADPKLLVRVLALEGKVESLEKQLAHAFPFLNTSL